MLTLIPVAQCPSELTDGSTKNPPLLQTEADVQSHSASLGRELGLLDLILTQILPVVVPDFFV
jgi:hypothetical protein